MGRRAAAGVGGRLAERRYWLERGCGAEHGNEEERGSGMEVAGRTEGGNEEGPVISVSAGTSAPAGPSLLAELCAQKAAVGSA